MIDHHIDYNDDYGRTVQVSDVIITDVSTELSIRFKINNVDVIVDFIASVGDEPAYKSSYKESNFEKGPVRHGVNVTTGEKFDKAISESRKIEIWDKDASNYTFRFIFEPIETTAGKKARLSFNVVRRNAL